MERHRTQAVIRCATLAGLAALALLLVPDPVQVAIRMNVRDALGPGQQAVAGGLDRCRSFMIGPDDAGAGAKDDITALRKRIRTLETALRNRDVQLAGERQKNQQRSPRGDGPYRPSSGEPLFVPELLETRVLSAEMLIDRPVAAQIGLGTDEVAVHMPVVDGEGLIVDHGDTSRIETGEPVYAGRNVVGRVIDVGRLTSRIQLVTDRGYSGRAQLARQSSRGLAFGAEGILEGTGGPVCRLTGIPVTEPVRVGDEVYTGGRSVMLPEPMYYGRVVRAEVTSESGWEIHVRPAIVDRLPDKVAVLRRSLNPVRVLGH